MKRTLMLGGWFLLFGMSFLQIFGSVVLAAPFPQQDLGWDNVWIGDEISGVAGPLPVNCFAPTYQSAQAQLDGQRSAWIAAAVTAIPGAAPLGSLIPGPTGTAVDSPLRLEQPDGFTITLTPVDLATDQGFNSGATSLGTPSFTNVQINGTPSGCTMQDNAPKASPSAAGDFYFNQLNNLRGLNGIRFSFSEPLQAFGAFFGDLETSLRGTTAFLRLVDANGLLVTDVPIASTLGTNGGIAAENAQCDQTNVPDAHVTAQGLHPGCGNGTTRWIGFVSQTPIAHALVIVGDNDPLPNGRGLTEKLSVMGPTVVRSLPAAEVAVHKMAPSPVTVGTPFNYTIVISNMSDRLAAGIVLTDVAPVGITFSAVTGPGCSLAADTVTCTLETLAAASTATVLVRATAQQTNTIANTAVVTAINDSDPANNSATTTIVSEAPPPQNLCASTVGVGNGSLVINEILYRQDSGGDNDEWVELFATDFIPAGTPFYVTDNESSSSDFAHAFTIPAGGMPAGSYIVVHLIDGTDDADVSDGVLHLYSNSGSPKLNNSGDNITLYQGSDETGIVLDYVAYGSGSAVNGPATGWTTPNGPTGASVGQSIAAIVNGADTATGSAWVSSGEAGTVGPSTPGADNRGLIACNVGVTKTGPAHITAGRSFNYQLTVSNTTAVTMTGIVVTDTALPGLSFIDVAGSGCNLASGTLNCAIGRLLPLASERITVTAVTTNQSWTTTAVVTNTVYTSAISDTFATDNRATHVLTIEPTGSIGDFVYLDANGNGDQDPSETTPINGVPITLTAATGEAYQTTSVDGSYQFTGLPAGTYTVTVGTLLGYQQTGPTAFPIMLAAGESYVQADIGLTYATADVRLDKAGPATVTLYDTFVYTLTVNNLSNTTPALDVVLTDTQPLGISFNSVVDPRCTLFDGNLTCNLGNLTPATAAVVTLTAQATMPGSWENSATATTANEADLTNNRADVTTLVPVPQLNLTYICGYVDEPQLVWRVTNNNVFAIDYTWGVYGSSEAGSGTVAANDIAYFTTTTGNKTVRLFAFGTLRSTKASGGACRQELTLDYTCIVGNRQQWTVTNPNNYVQSFTWQSDLDEIGTGQAPATGTTTFLTLGETTAVTLTYPNDPLAARVVTATATPCPQPALSLEKRVLRPIASAVNVGETVIYGLTVRNTGTITLTQLTLVDHYDTTYLQYDTASITPTLQSSGLLTWTLAASTVPLPLSVGEVMTVTVTFTAIQPE